MEIKDQVANFELSKKLFELGFKSNHIFDWKEFCNDDYWGKRITFKTIYFKAEDWRHDKIVYLEKGDGHYFSDEEYIINEYPAYTVAELGVLLPRDIDHNLNDWSESYYILYAYSSPIDDRPSEPSVWYEDNDLHGDDMILHGTGGATEADARAQMLIWLIENGKIKIENGN